MALYEVTRTDEVGPGEFVSATVIAGGTAQARNAVANMSGVSKGAKNVRAERINLTDSIQVLAAYFDERETEPYGSSDEYANDVSAPGAFNW